MAVEWTITSEGKNEFGDVCRKAVRIDKSWWLLVGVFAQSVTYVCAGGVWWLALRYAGYPISLLSLAPLGLAKLFADQALPTGGASGTMLVTAGLRNKSIPLRVAFATMMAGLLSNYSASFLAASVGFLVLLIKHRMGGALAAVFALFALVTIIVPLFVMLMKMWSSAPYPGLDRPCPGHSHPAPWLC